MNQIAIDISTHHIEHFCQKHHICSLAFFGSVVRDDFGPHSDVDVLVEFEEGHTPGFDFFLLEEELSQLLGHKVDLQTANFLSPEIRQIAIEESVNIYEQA
ncbi:MAG: nucleotidyltransferase family protein [Anaerolineaceae bacterium]|nr:nucleotidyltransferase family protein [Anaerolineaceae bacterium]